MKTSMRPKKNPAFTAMSKSKRPKTRSDYEVEKDVEAAYKGYKNGGCVMAGRGGKYKGTK